MKVSFFIAKKLLVSEKKSFSRFISNIAIIAITLSVSVMLVSTAIVNGFTTEIQEKIFGFWGEITVFHSGDGDISEEFPVDMSMPVFSKIKKLPEIESINPYATKAVILKTSDEMEGMVMKGVDENYNWKFLKQYLIKGKIPTISNNSISRDILISSTTANRLSVDSGQSILIYFMKKDSKLPIGRKFTISGIYNTGLDEYDQKFILGDIALIQKINKWENNRVGGIEIKLKDSKKMMEIEDKIYRTMLDQTLSSSTIKSQLPNIFEWLDLQKTNEFIILTLMIIVATFNMITALLILILDRTQMIGILKAMGAKTRVIQQIFLYKAGYIILNGLFWGNFIGLSICFIQKKFEIIKLPEKEYYLSVAPIKLDFLPILFINFGTLFICLLILLLPSFFISKIKPVQAIRFN